MRPRLLCCILALAATGNIPASPPLSTDSPFMGPGNQSNQAPAAENADYEFVGALRVGDKTSLAILNKTTQKNFWVNVGATVDGFSVQSRDDKTGDIVVSYGGNTQTLRMRAAAAGQAVTPVSYSPPAQTTPQQNPGIVPPQVPNRPLTQNEQEREARMLVSDLLEIGMQQRKAHEEAMRRSRGDGQNQPRSTPAPVNPADPSNRR